MHKTPDLTADARRARRALIAPLAICLACLALAAWVWRQNRTWPYRATYPLRDRLANLNQLGVNVELTQYETAELDRVLAQIEAGGYRWVRQRFPWDQIEPQRGVSAWAPWDAIVDACAARQLAVIAVLDQSPPWARLAEAASDVPTPPGEVQDWGAFAARLAGRYRGRIAAYQLWDEPNLTDHWGHRYVDPVAYAALLREGAIRIRGADPGAIILLAALAPTTENGPLNLNEVAFLEGVLEAGGRPFFDAVALQPYGFGDPPDARSEPARLNYRRVAWVRREMVRLGMSGLPIWATSGGWNALPEDWQGRPSPWSAVTGEEQIGYTLDAIQMARREWPWMGPMVLYPFQPRVPVDDPRWGFALLDSQGNPRPLYDRLRQYQDVGPPSYVGHYIPDPYNARYRGEWRFSGAGADPPHGADLEQQDARLSFDWQGTALDLTVRRGDFWGVLYVTVDGRPARGLPRDEKGRAYIILYDPLGQEATINLARGLSPRTVHHVEIVADGGWGQWPLVSWTVHREQAPPPDLTAAWLLALMGFGAAAYGTAQIVVAPHLLRPVYRTVGGVFGWYRSLPEPAPILATLGAAVAYYLIPWAPASTAFLALWFFLALLRIDLGLATVALALPFYLRPASVLGRPISAVELGVWLCTLAWGLARLLDLGRAAAREGPQSPAWRLQQAVLAAQRFLDRLRSTAGGWRGWRESLSSHALDVGMAMLVLISAVSLTWSEHQGVAIREWRTVFLESALFYALIRLALRSPRAHWRVIEGWLLGATIVSLIGIWQWISSENLISADGVWRVRGLYGSPNNLALYLERAVPVLLAVAWQGMSHTRRDRLRRVAYGAAAVPILAALFLTLSRGALLLGLPAALLALGLFQPNRKATWIAVGAVVILAMLLLSLAFGGRLRSLVDLGQGTVSFRLKLWRSTVSMILDHPITGVGPDNFLYAYRTRYMLPSAWEEPDLSHPHNLLLDAWTRLGLGGLTVTAWLVVSFFRMAWRRFQDATGNRRALLLGLLGAMVAMLAHGLVDHAIFVVDLAFLLSSILAMACKV